MSTPESTPNTFTMGSPMPESTLSPTQGLWIWPLINEDKNSSKFVSLRSENNSLFSVRHSISSYLKKSLKQFEENLEMAVRPKNPRVSIGSLQVTEALCLRIELSILLVILLGLGSQIEIFGEAPPNLKNELKIPLLQVPHYYELHEDLPQGPQPGPGHR